MEVLLILVMGFMCIACFIVGAKVGQTVSKGEEIKLPSINPMDAVRKHQERKEAEIEQDRLEAIMRNLEAYNGTEDGQKDIPRG